MSKSVSLLLSAALTLGSVFSTSAAPLAKKAGAAKSPSPVTAKVQQTPAGKCPMVVSRAMASPGNAKGIARIQSQLKATNRKALRSATSAARAVAAGTDLRGTLTYCSSWSQGAAQYGLYNVPSTEGGQFEMIVPNTNGYLAGYDDGDGTFYGFYNVSVMGLFYMYYIDVVDIATGEILSSASVDQTLQAFDTATDPVSGIVYGQVIDTGGDGFVWAQLDYSVPSREDIAIQDTQLLGIGATSTGQFYGVGSDGVFYKIDKETGELEEIGNTGLTLKYLTGGCVNAGDETFLMAFNNDSEAGLAEIDIATGEATVLVNYTEDQEVNCLYIAKPAAADKAPAAPGLSVSCDNGSMDVNVSLTMPTTLFDGTPADGQTFTYSVLANGVEIGELTGSAVAGEEVTKTITLSASGFTKFVATASNSTGSSPKAKASCYVGKGAPAAPTNVALTWADGTATLTWDPVTKASDGGFLDPAEVTYTILDMEGAELATQAATTFTAPVPLPPAYTLIGYSVKANNDGKSSEAVASNKVALGELAPPVSMDMTQPDNFAAHTVFDANGDGKTWAFTSNRTAYTYSTANEGDDWLFSPAITLKAGKFYRVSANVSARGASLPERIEIFAGEAPTVDGMTIEIVRPTDVVGTAETLLEAYLTVESDGKYNIGFHAISDADMYSLYLNSYKIVAVEGSAPLAVTDAKVVPDFDGALRADISFKAPLKSVDGNTLTGNVKVKVFRGETEVDEVSVAPGNVGNVQDADIPQKGTYTYTLVSYNAAGDEGETVRTAAYVGPKTPADIDTETVSLVETTPGTFVLDWGAVTTAADGSAINPANVSYKVYTIVVNPETGGLALGEELATVSETTYTHVTEPITEQGYFRLGVQPFNVDEPAEYIALGAVLTGTPYEMPVQYTNQESLNDYFLAVGGDGQVSFANYEMFEIPAQDGDDTFFAIKNPAALDATTSIISGLVNISGEKPVAQFYVWPIDIDDTNETVVSVICEGQETPLATYVHADEFEAGSWNKVKVSLAAFVGKTVQVKISAVVKHYLYTMVDNINICQDIDYDLSASIAAPAKVEAGKEFDVNVTVSNEGAEDTDSYTVNLLRDGEVVDSKVFNYGLAADEKDVATFKQTISLHDGESATYKAVIVYEADQNPENNETAEVVVSRAISTLPAVTGLQGEKTEGGNSLTWDPIVIDEPSPKDVTETFEDAESWAHEFDGWTFVDGDNSLVGGFQNINLPGITPGSTFASFFVFDTTLDGINDNPTFAAHSGEKYLAALFRYDDGQVDDWAISPLLTGEAQTISFFAKSYSAQYPEKIELWYSTSDTQVESFIRIEEFGTQTLSAEWTEYSAQLPQGAKHFAIRSCASSSFMLMIDDITFTRLEGFDGELKGYNVYCDGVKLNDAPVAEASYLHVPADDAAHTYHVTAVYDKGESELSEPVTIDQSGIGAVLAVGLKVAVEGRSIVVTGAADNLVTINAVDGKPLHAAKGDARVSVAPAVYLVTADGKTVKVIVR